MNRLEKLRELEGKLSAMLESADAKSIAAIAKQYRETIREIEEIEGLTDTNDDIADLLAEREADGKAEAVRKSKTKV